MKEEDTWAQPDTCPVEHLLRDRLMRQMPPWNAVGIWDVGSGPAVECGHEASHILFLPLKSPKASGFVWQAGLLPAR